MTHEFGALELPANTPLGCGLLTDPAMGVLSAYFGAVLVAFAGKAWENAAPGEPLVRKTFGHDPEEADFSESDLPLLCVWREQDDQPKRLTDGHQETETSVRILWIAPPAHQVKSANRFPFFNAFDKAINFAVLRERDPAYVHPAETADDAAKAWGSDVQRLAGIERWRLSGAVSRQSVSVSNGATVDDYAGYMATLRIFETSTVDPVAYGTLPSGLRFDVTSGGTDPLVLQQAEIPPKP